MTNSIYLTSKTVVVKGLTFSGYVYKNIYSQSKQSHSRNLSSSLVNHVVPNWGGGGELVS